MPKDDVGRCPLYLLCYRFYLRDNFSILAKARTQFHLATLEAIFIKTRKPILYRLKEFVYSLQILK